MTIENDRYTCGKCLVTHRIVDEYPGGMVDPLICPDCWMPFCAAKQPGTKGEKVYVRRRQVLQRLGAKR